MNRELSDVDAGCASSEQSTLMQAGSPSAGVVGLGRDPRGRVATRGLGLAISAAFIGALTALSGAAPAFADTTAPGLSVFTGLSSWISQYGIAGAPVAIALGGLLFAVEHHQQRTGNAIRAKGYIFAACAGLIVIGLASTIASAAGGLGS